MNFRFVRSFVYLFVCLIFCFWVRIAPKEIDEDSSLMSFSFVLFAVVRKAISILRKCKTHFFFFCDEFGFLWWVSVSFCVSFSSLK